MGIEVLLRSSELTTRTVQVANAAASTLAQSGGEIHAESFGRPRDTRDADLVVFQALLPDATIVGSNPSWDTDIEDD